MEHEPAPASLIDKIWYLASFAFTVSGLIE
ncbi:uncharacterized protein METZ01_LOCUS193245 [marine metagenome]|uniref:Uncharacterized protein n=1 Tax=marine metagenome TaxID=408172 RepID=A0A382DRM8_9ZZZZ